MRGRRTLPVGGGQRKFGWGTKFQTVKNQNMAQEDGLTEHKGLGLDIFAVLVYL